MWSKILGTTAALMVSVSAMAQSLQLGEPTYGGNGCPAGTASVSVSPAQDAVSILFDQYLAESGGITGRRIDRKSCNITVPVSVPQGYSIAVLQVDYRGFNAIPAGGYSRFDANYFWAGSQGVRISRVFTGPSNSNFSVTDNLTAATLVWTPCGAKVNLRVNSSMMAQSNGRLDQTLAAVDSADISAGLIYHFQWRRCNQ